MDYQFKFKPGDHVKWKMGKGEEARGVVKSCHVRANRGRKDSQSVTHEWYAVRNSEQTCYPSVEYMSKDTPQPEYELGQSVEAYLPAFWATDAWMPSIVEGVELIPDQEVLQYKVATQPSRSYVAWVPSLDVRLPADEQE